MESLFSDCKTACTQKVALLGMPDCGATQFRQAMYRLGYSSTAFKDNERKYDGLWQTSVVLKERNFVDLCFKRFEDEEYEWEGRKVTIDLIEPIDVSLAASALKNAHTAIIFIDATAPKSSYNTWLPCWDLLEQLPPIILIYNCKKRQQPPFHRMRSNFNYEKFIRRCKNQVLEFVVSDLDDKEELAGLASAIIRQGTLKHVLALPLPNRRVVQQCPTEE